MEWTDEGIVLGVRRHGESSAIVELLTREHGRHLGLVRGGAGTAMVGSFTEIADLIEAYHEVGIDEFVLSGYPHLEESYWFGEGVLPELTRRGLWEHPAPVAVSASVPFGSPAPLKRVSAS